MNTDIILVDDQDTRDIIHWIIKWHKNFASDYDHISSLFWRGNDIDTAEYIFDFCIKNIFYCIETKEDQTVKSPAAIIATGVYKDGYNDCKHYSLFIAGILDSLKRKGYPIEWTYRFANYDIFETLPQHVFVILFDEHGNETWIDPVLQKFDYKKRYVNAIDKNVDTMLRGISGISTAQGEQIESDQAQGALDVATGNYAGAVTEEIASIETTISALTSKTFTPSGRVTQTQTNLVNTLQSYGLEGPNGIYSKFAETNNAGGLNMRISTTDFDTIYCWSGNGAADYESIGLTIQQFGGNGFDLVTFVLNSGYVPTAIDTSPTYGNYWPALQNFYNENYQSAAGSPLTNAVNEALGVTTPTASVAVVPVGSVAATTPVTVAAPGITSNEILIAGAIILGVILLSND